MQRWGARLVAAIVLCSSPADAGWFSKKCGDGAPGGNACPVSYKTEERTVMVCETTYETKTINVTEMVPTQKVVERTVTRFVRETKPEQRQVTTCRPIQKTRTVNVTVCTKVPTTEPRTCTVCVPYKETVNGTRTVCNLVKTTEMKTVTKDCGHFEKQCVQVGCRTVKNYDGCCVEEPVYKTKKVWVPNLVTTQVPVTSCKRVYSQVPCTYTVTKFRQETKTENVTFCKLVQTTEPRTQTYCEMVPETKTVTLCVTTCKPVTETIKQTVTVCEAKQVQRQVKVPHTKMVEKKVKVQVPVYATDAACADCK